MLPLLRAHSQLCSRFFGTSYRALSFGLTRHQHNAKRLAATDSNTTARPSNIPFQPDIGYQRTQNRTTRAQYNLQMERYASNGKFGECLNLAAQMKIDGITPSLQTYNHLLYAACRCGLSLEAWAIMEDMALMQVEPDAYSFQYLVIAQRLKEQSYVWRVLDKQKEKGIEPTSTTYSHLLERFIAEDNLEFSLRILQDMRGRGVVPDLRVAQSLVILAGRLGYPKLAIDLIDSFEKESPRRLDHEVWMHCLIAAAESLYAEGVIRCWRVIVQELNLSPDEGLCIAVLHTAARHGLPDLATDVLRVLKVIGCPWQEHHLAPVVEAFSRAGLLKDAFITLDIMRSSDIQPLPETALPILHSINQDVDSIDNTWQIIDQMHKDGIRIDVAALNVILQATVSVGDLQRAVGTYKSYPDYGVKPDVHTFNFMLEGCIAAAHRELGDRLLADMKEVKIKPNHATYVNLILLCLTQETYEDAFFYLEEMKAAKYRPPIHVYEAIIRRCLTDQDSRYAIAVAEMKDAGYQFNDLMRADIEAASQERRPLSRQRVESIKQESTPSVGLDGAAKVFIDTGGLRGSGSA